MSHISAFMTHLCYHSSEHNAHVHVLNTIWILVLRIKPLSVAACYVHRPTDNHHILFHLSVSSPQDCTSLVTQVQSIILRRTTTSQWSGASRPNPTSPSPRWRSTVCSCPGWRCFITWTTVLTSLSTSSSQDGFSATKTLSEQDGSDFMCPESGLKTRACTSAGWPLDLAGRSHSSHSASPVSRDRHVKHLNSSGQLKRT